MQQGTSIMENLRPIYVCKTRYDLTIGRLGVIRRWCYEIFDVLRSETDVVVCSSDNEVWFESKESAYEAGHKKIDLLESGGDLQ